MLPTAMSDALICLPVGRWLLSHGLWQMLVVVELGSRFAVEHLCSTAYWIPLSEIGPVWVGCSEHAVQGVEGWVSRWGCRIDWGVEP